LRPLQLMLAGGATDFEIAHALGIHKDTLYDWKRQSPELAAMMLASKEGFDIRIERSLAASALGYTYPAEKIFMVEGKVIRVPYVEHVKPDTQAIKFWLMNRHPDRWREVTRLIDETPPSAAEEPSDARKVAMAMLNVIRQGMMKRGELPAPPPAFTQEFDHVANETRSAEGGPAARAGQDEAPASDRGSGQGERRGSEGAGDSADDADYRADRSRPAGRRRRISPRYRDEGDDGIDLD
jgi:hypothetical protein